MLQRAEDLDAGRLSSEDLKGCSLWVGHGTDDWVTSFRATARFMDRLEIKDKTFRVYDGHYHKRTFGHECLKRSFADAQKSTLSLEMIN